MKARIPSVITTTFLILSLTAHSQGSWRIEHLGVPQGLSEGNVYVIHQDRTGFIWIGTHGGLNRYDGYGFRIHQYSPFDATTLGDNAVFFLQDDSTTGKFWIGGSSCLNEFDPTSFRNTRYVYQKKQLEFADGLFVTPGEILLACEHDVLLFDLRTKRFSELPVHDEGGKPVQIARVENLATDRKGNVMVMSRTGVFFYDSASRSCVRKTPGSPDFSRFNESEIFNVTHDAAGNYWIATNKQGLIHYNPVSGASTPIALPRYPDGDLPRFDVVMEDSRGTVWAGSSRGLFRINKTSLVAEQISLTGEEKSISDEPEVNAIAEDNNGLLWIGTIGSGVCKIIPLNSGFRNLNLSRRNNGSGIGSYVMAVNQLHDEIWFVNIWDQVGSVNLHSGRTRLLTNPTLPETYGWYSEGTLIRDSENQLLLLNGESRYDISESEDNRVSVRSERAPGLSYVYEARNKKRWHMVKAPVGNTFQRNDTIYGNQFFFDAREDDAGNLWMGSSKGLIRFNPAENSFIHFQHDAHDRETISSDFIYKLQIDSRQVIWMAAYHGGLCSYDITSQRFRHYSTRDGLADNTVYSIEKDHKGNMWFSSNAGISSYDVVTGTFRNYGVNDGLLNHEFNRRSSFKNEDGWIFFGGIDGIDFFHPDSIGKDQTRPVLAFTNFKIMDSDYLPEQSGSPPVIKLNPEDHQITIEFASLEYRDQQKIQYAYRINDDPWIKVGSQHLLSFSNLLPGDHPLFIRSTNNEGLWLDNEISCVISVQPSWWQTWWSKTAIVLLGLGLIATATRIYYKRKLEKQRVILERQQAVERERTRIATDMHDDLGANLSRIKFLSETIGLKKQRQEPFEEEINSIRQYAFDMMDRMGEIVWALNERNDTLSDLLAYTRSYAVDYLSQNGIKTKVITPDDVPNIFVTGDYRRNIYLTVKEALHNIVRHANADTVEISVNISDGLSVRIQDNGRGFNEENIRPFSNGISNMRKRVASLGGRFEIHNNKGSTVFFAIPLP